MQRSPWQAGCSSAERRCLRAPLPFPSLPWSFCHTFCSSKLVGIGCSQTAFRVYSQHPEPCSPASLDVSQCVLISLSSQHKVAADEEKKALPLFLLVPDTENTVVSGQMHQEPAKYRDVALDSSRFQLLWFQCWHRGMNTLFK